MGVERRTPESGVLRRTRKESTGEENVCEMNGALFG